MLRFIQSILSLTMSLLDSVKFIGHHSQELLVVSKQLYRTACTTAAMLLRAQNAADACAIKSAFPLDRYRNAFPAQIIPDPGFPPGTDRSAFWASGRAFPFPLPLLSPFCIPLSDRFPYRFFVPTVGLLDRFPSGAVGAPLPLFCASGRAFRYRKIISKGGPVPLFCAPGTANRNYRKTIPNKKKGFLCVRYAKFRIKIAL